MNLRFLVLIDISSRQQLSVQALDKLKTLFLLNCNIGDTDGNSFPKSLETLCIWECELPTPLNLTKLMYLRKLEIYRGNVSQMVTNTISSLSCLKELHLENRDRVSDGDLEKTVMPKFNEISKLTCLTSLKIAWSDFEPYQDTSIFRNLLEFDISVGVREILRNTPPSDVSSTRRIELTGKLQFDCFQGLVETAEEVILWNTEVSISKFWNSNRQAFEDLRNLYIECCDTVEYLARIPQYSLQQQSSFSKLTTLGIEDCSAMKYLFNNYVAKCFVQL